MRIVKMSLSIVLFSCLLLGVYSESLACATFMLKSKKALIVGHNVDFNSDYMPGYVFINKRGIAKTNFTLNDMNGKWDWTPRIRWTSKYGSVTFNPMIIELSPTAGINEAGLFIAEMSLTTTKYPTNPFLPNMLANQWMQYQLDNYRSVDEVLKNIRKIVPGNEAPNHYFISDKRGKCACIEYIKGKAVIFRGESMPVPLLCNSEYPYELRLLKKYRGFGGTRSVNQPIEGTDSRFAQGADLIKKYPSSPAKPIVDYGFDILTQMWRGNNKWAFVIDLNHRTVYFHTSRSRGMKSFSYKPSDFAPDTPAKMFDMNSNTSGDVTGEFTPYSPQLVKYAIVERLKQNNPRVDNGEYREIIDALVKRARKFLNGIQDTHVRSGEALFKYSFVIKKLDPLKVASLRATLHSSAEQDTLWHELIGFLQAKKIAANGPGFTIYHGTNEQGVDLEVVFPVTDLGSDGKRVKFKTLDAVDEMASATLQGPYKEFPRVYAALNRWLAENGYQSNGPNREIWLRSGWNEKNPNELVTEVQIPVKRKNS